MTVSRSDLAECARLLGRTAPGLLVACLALPGPAREAALVVGAVNALFLGEARRDGVDPDTIALLRERVLRAYAGAATDLPLDRALQWLATEVRMPRIVFDAALEAASWDATGRRYATIDNLLDYAVRAGGAPAVAIAFAMDARERSVLSPACDLGVGITLTMIARDVGKHARQGRVLLPLEWLEEEGVDVDAWISRPVASSGVRATIERTLHTAEGFLRRSDPGMRGIAARHRPTVRALRYSYALEAAWIAENGYDTVEERRSIPLRRRAQVVARSLRSARSEERFGDESPSSNASFLLDRVARDGPMRPL